MNEEVNNLKQFLQSIYDVQHCISKVRELFVSGTKFTPRFAWSGHRFSPRVLQEHKFNDTDDGVI